MLEVFFFGGWEDGGMGVLNYLLLLFELLLLLEVLVLFYLLFVGVLGVVLF